MSRRIDIELTSTRDDGSWTWRAAGARQPKGVVPAAMLPGAPAVGDVLRAEVEIGLDGTEVLGVAVPKGSRPEPARLELFGREEPETLVTTTLAPRRGGREGRERGDRRPSDRPAGDRPPGDRPPGDRPSRDRPPGERRDRAERRDGRERPAGERRGRDRRPAPAGAGGGDGDRASIPRAPRPDRDRGADSRPRRSTPPADTRPRPKRLRAGRAHRAAVLDTLAVEERPVAEQVLRGGIPAVRQAVDKQNEQARAEGRPEIKPEPMVDLAEQLLPRLRVAEWRDRAEAARADLDELDLRDLRSVIVAADTAARDEDSRALAAELRAGLARRVEEEQSAWLREITGNLAEGRVVRALRLSSRPPKAGALLPPDLTTRLVEAAAGALTEETPQDRWATVLEALSFSPVHLKVLPPTVPAAPSDALLAAVRKTASRLPQIAARFGIEPPAAPARRRGGAPAPDRSPASEARSGLLVPPPPPRPADAPPPPAPAASPPPRDVPPPAVEAISPVPPTVAPSAPEAQPTAARVGEPEDEAVAEARLTEARADDPPDPVADEVAQAEMTAPTPPAPPPPGHVRT